MIESYTTDSAEALAERQEDPPGIDPTTLDLPDVQEAAERVAEFLREFGDGRIDPEHLGAPPLFARDLEALSRHASGAVRHAAENVIELSICEVPQVALRVGPTYRFYALEGCATCEKAVSNYPGQTLTPRAALAEEGDRG